MKIAEKIKHLRENPPDNVLQQSLIRIVMLCFLTSYFYVFRESIERYDYVLMTCLGSFVFAFIALFGFSSSKKRNTFKVTTAFLDMAILTYMIYLSNDAGSPLIFLYLWITFGNGLRFGKQLLLVSTIFSIISFTIVINFSEFWQEQKNLAYGFFIITIALSLYISLLITKLHAAVADAKAANEAKTQFLSNMSHEIRTPLNGIIGISSLLSTTPLDSRQADYSSTINASAKTLLSLINNILDISKIEAGMAKVELVDFDLHSLINSTALMLSSQAENKGVDFDVFISPNVPLLLHGNQQYLRQILINLIGNAIKFTNEGFIKINITSLNKLNNKTRLRFEVIDSGIGIPDQAKATIFDKFTQVDQSPTRQFTGSGLGMSIAKQLVESMDGIIDFSSELGKGSTFWFEVELELQDKPSEEKKGSIDFNSQDTNKKPLSNKLLKNLNILIAEDNPTNQKVIESILEYGQHNAILVNNGKEALEHLKEESYDLIILDMQMPVMGGIEASKLFHITYPQKNTPILILTANATIEAAEECKEANVDAYLTKPIEPDKLLETISSLVKESRNLEKEKTIDSSSLLDTEALDTLFSMTKKENFMRDLVDGYVSDTASMIQQLTTLVENADNNEIRKVFHTLDGSSRSIGAKKLVLSIQTLSNLIKERNESLTQEHIQGLNFIFEQTKVALNQFLDEKNQSK